MSNVEILAESLQNLSIDSEIINIEMATIQAAKEIASTIRHFSGRSEHLESFLNACDKFFERYGRTNDNSLNEFVFASIYSKIVDEAGDYILCRPDLNTWPQVKQALRDKFGDKIDRHVLQQQLVFLTRHKNESTLDFVDRIKILKMRLNLKINADPQINPATKLSLIDQNEVTAVTILMSNASPELRTLLMLKNPRNIDEATSTVINHSQLEQQISLHHKPNFHQNHQNHMKPFHRKNNYYNNNHHNNLIRSNNPNTYHHNPRYNYPSFHQNQPQHFNNQHLNNQQSFNTRFPSQPIQFTQRNTPKQHFPTNEQVFGKPPNVFEPKNSYKPQSKPEPMSTSSRLPSNRQNTQNYRFKNAFQRTGPPNFEFRELTNVETNEKEINAETEDFVVDNEHSIESSESYQNFQINSLHSNHR